MDVTSLYTNIPHDEGIEACRKVWDARTYQKPSTDCLVELLTHILERNNFVFNEEHFTQINGTSMGTKMAPAYANVFMGDLERRLIENAPYKPFSWLRFIDDIEMKWTHGRQALDEFVAFANDFHPSIKFTVEISNSSNVFLDTRSSLINGNIEFDLHTKPTDSHLYLMPTSCHPKHVFKAIPVGLATRLKRNCSTTSAFETRSQELKQQLCSRGYSPRQVNHAIGTVATKDRSVLLQYKEKKPNKRVPFVVTYHPSLGNLSSILHKHLPTLHSSQKMKKVFPEPPVVSFKKPKT